MSIDDGTGGASNVGYDGGAQGAGNAPPSRPAEHTDDRCAREVAKTALACGKLVRGFDLFQVASCALEVSSLVSCVEDRVANPKK